MITAFTFFIIVAVIVVAVVVAIIYLLLLSFFLLLSTEYKNKSGKRLTSSERLAHQVRFTSCLPCFSPVLATCSEGLEKEEEEKNRKGKKYSPKWVLNVSGIVAIKRYNKNNNNNEDKDIEEKTTEGNIPYHFICVLFSVVCHY